MTRAIPLRPRSVFDDTGYAATIEALTDQVQELYLADEVPWVVGYSGGKDSTAVLQLVWLALAGLDAGQRRKPVHVISTDTLVENPVVATWVAHSLELMGAAAAEQGLPIQPNRLTPAVADSFWVNLIGRGYPAPRHKFRWCTERLKIKPSNKFIRDVVRAHGEAILVLGTRKAESSGRAHRMAALEAQRARDLLSPNAALPNCLVYTPVENWSNDDVWTFLMQTTNPWGYSNKDLLSMYQGASPDGECPLVVDATTPSCGDSRFGCWVCTLVEKDKSMSAMIQNDEEKEWMLPLLELRNQLDVADDRHLRDFRRMNGAVQLFHDRPIPGPYTQEAREQWLRKLLEAQSWIRGNGPAHVRSLELIRLGELEEIRRIWVVDKHEFEDRLPVIYADAVGEPYPGRTLDEHLPLGPAIIDELRAITTGDRLHFEMIRELLDIEQRHRARARRAGLFTELEDALRRGFYDDEADATAHAQDRRDKLSRAVQDNPDPVDEADGFVREVTGDRGHVILDELVLHDVGVFGGRNQITLSPPSQAKPVVLIGGLNGAGKTTILDAIHLVLYGPLSSPVARRSGGYDAYLRSLIHHAARPSDGAAVELAFHAHHEGAERSYRIRRLWRETGSGIREKLEVLRDGMLDETLTATWAEHVEAFLPRGIAGLFFFDGEQIESLADLDQSRRVLSSALAALLGLELVDRLGADLAVLRRRRRSRQVPDEVHQRVEAAKGALTQGRLEEEAAEDARLAAQRELDQLHKRHFELAEHYRAQGGELLDQREPAEKRVASAHAELKRIDTELKETAEGAAPMLMLATVLQELAAQAHRESEAARDRVVLDVLVTRDHAVLDQLRSLCTRTSAIAAVEESLAIDRAARHRSAEIEPVTGLSDPSAVEFLIGRGLPETRQKVAGLLARRVQAETELDTAERMLSAIPDPETLAPVRAERDHMQDALLRAEASLVHTEERLGALRQQRIRAQAVYEKALDAAALASLAADDDRRVVDHIDRVQVTLKALKQAAIRRHLDRIAALMLDALRQLMRKENLITEISIDPDTYEVELRGSSGQPLTAEQLSVGERQLLAVAMLWGLAHAAGQPLPVVIDTPLGRLDSSHRHHLVDRYFPQASHQVVLLSTDTEIDADARNRLQRHIGRAYRLDFDPAAAATTIRPGYFWEP